ncbi:MAG: flavodoxin family protein [Bacteroidetes bacterium]|nr:MAG: flavodoxin family protein [Bacteroidota bacterium]
MKVTAFVGSARKKHTYLATERFLKSLQKNGDVDFEIVALADYNLKTCRGCKLCLDKGEELCPLKDDRDILMEKVRQSDGVVFATPNYSFQVSGLMKVFLDRFGYVFHRPEYFGKTFTGIVAQGVYGGKEIVKYLDFVGSGMGFNVVSGFLINTREPVPESEQVKTEKAIEKQSLRFYRQLARKEYPSPSMLKLMIFRMSRTSLKAALTEDFKDYRHFRDQGWFDNDYYYPVKLNPVKRTAGWLFDITARRMAAAN